MTPEREKLLETLEACGSAEMPIAETLAIAEMSEEQFAADEEAQGRYRIGHLKTKLKVRQSVVKMAREGVPQMVKIYLDFNRESEADAEPPAPQLPAAEVAGEQPPEGLDDL